jgi:hypothetical protein
MAVANAEQSVSRSAAIDHEILRDDLDEINCTT